MRHPLFLFVLITSLMIWAGIALLFVHPAHSEPAMPTCTEMQDDWNKYLHNTKVQVDVNKTLNFFGVGVDYDAPAFSGARTVKSSSTFVRCEFAVAFIDAELLCVLNHWDRRVDPSGATFVTQTVRRDDGSLQTTFILDPTAEEYLILDEKIK